MLSVDLAVEEPLEHARVEPLQARLFRDDHWPKLFRVTTDDDAWLEADPAVDRDRVERNRHLGLRGLRGLVDEQELEVWDEPEARVVDEWVQPVERALLELRQAAVGASYHGEDACVRARRDDDSLLEENVEWRQLKSAVLRHVAVVAKSHAHLCDGSTRVVEAEELLRLEVSRQSSKERVGRGVGCAADKHMCLRVYLGDLEHSLNQRLRLAAARRTPEQERDGVCACQDRSHGSALLNVQLAVLPVDLSLIGLYLGCEKQVVASREEPSFEELSRPALVDLGVQGGMHRHQRVP